MATSAQAMEGWRPEVLKDQLAALDEVVREIYGCTHSEFMYKIFLDASENAFEEGWQKGRASGRRAAKGLKGEPKKRGRPPKIDSSIRTLLMVHVNQEREKGKPVKEAIAELSEIIRRGAEPLGASVFLPTTTKASQVYYRDRKKKPRDRKRKHP